MGNIFEKVGSAYILNHELNRWQYLFNTEFCGNINVDSFNDEIDSEIMMIEFDNFHYLSMETYNNINESDGIVINISTSENYIQSVETDNIIIPDIVANDFDLQSLNSNIE